MVMIIPRNFFWQLAEPCYAWLIAEHDDCGRVTRRAQLIAPDRASAVAIWMVHCQSPFMVRPAWEHN